MRIETREMKLARQLGGDMIALHRVLKMTGTQENILS